MGPLHAILKWGGIALGALAVAAVLAVGYVYFASQAIIDKTYPLRASAFHASADAAALARGEHLTVVLGCADCHGAGLTGQLFADVPGSAIYSRNLTLLARDFSDADFDRAIRHGVRPDGRSVLVMPSDVYSGMSDGELSAIVGYLRSLKAQGAATPEPSIGLVVRFALVTGQLKTDVAYFADDRPSLDLGPRFAAGRHLAAIACAECHSTSLAGTPQDPILVTPDLALVASYERADFAKLMRTGKAAGNRELGVMSQTARLRFAHFSDAEINALYDYLAARGQKLAATPG